MASLLVHYVSIISNFILTTYATLISFLLTFAALILKISYVLILQSYLFHSEDFLLLS